MEFWAVVAQKSEIESGTPRRFDGFEMKTSRISCNEITRVKFYVFIRITAIDQLKHVKIGNRDEYRPTRIKTTSCYGGVSVYFRIIHAKHIDYKDPNY